MKNFLAVLAFLTFIALPAFAADGYSSIIDDLPLMPGMQERTDDAVVFDKPGGRIVDTTAETSSSAADVLRFYMETLPPLGWQQRPNATFTRASEMLKITIDNKGRTSVVHFSLTPQQEGKQP